MQSHVHRYRGTREERLVRLVVFMWEQFTPEQRAELRPGIEADDMGWAIPAFNCRDADDWLTIEELAAELGLTASGVRNWHSRYGLKPVRGRYRWGDVADVKRQRFMQKCRQAV